MGASQRRSHSNPENATSEYFELLTAADIREPCNDSIQITMQIEQIVSLLIAERDRLSRAIEALGGPARRGRPQTQTSIATPAPAPAPKKRRMSAAGRRAIAEAARRRWAAMRASQAAPVPSSESKSTASVAVKTANPAAKKKSAPKVKHATHKKAAAKS